MLIQSGIPAWRNNQWGHGGKGRPDVNGIAGFHVECKRREHLNIHDAFRQSERDADGLKPCVAHRRNCEPWLITLRLDDFLHIFLENEQQQTTIRELVRLYGGKAAE